MTETESKQEVQRLVNRMTNWQRNKWAKAGYPGAQRSASTRFGKRDADPRKVKPFTELMR